MHTISIRKRVAAFFVASSLIWAGLAATSTAQAATPQEATIDVSVEAAGAQATYTAYLLGEYDNLQFDPATGALTSLKFKAVTNGDANTAIKTAVEGEAPSDANVESTVPLNWVAAADTTSAFSAYAGSLANFAAALAVDSDFTGNATSEANTDFSSSAAAKGDTISFTNLTQGLYLIVDSTFSSTVVGTSQPLIVGTKAYNPDTLNWVDFADGGTGLKPALGVAVLKNDDTSYIKKNIVNNDPNGYSIGDSIEYEVRFPIPTVSKDPETVSVTDTAGDGLTLPAASGVKVYAGTNPTELQNAGSVSVGVSGQTITVSNLQSLFAVNSGSWSNVDTIKVGGEDVDVSAGREIIIRYTATVDEDATSVTPGTDLSTPDLLENNTNTAELDYEVLSLEDDDAKDSATFYTYALEFKKVDKDDTGKALVGAEFTIAREAAPGTALNVVETTPNSSVYRLSLGANGVVTSKDDEGTFRIEGLQAGSYVIKETSAPDGYFAVDAFTATIAATFAAQSTTVDRVVYELPAGDTDTTWLGDINVSSGIAHTIYVGDPSVSFANLPYTGGIGIAIFLIVGVAVTVVGIRAHRQSAKAEQFATSI